jgi:hypothetical protein
MRGEDGSLRRSFKEGRKMIGRREEVCLRRIGRSFVVEGRYKRNFKTFDYDIRRKFDEEGRECLKIEKEAKKRG